MPEERTPEAEHRTDSMPRLDIVLLLTVMIAAFIVFILLGYSLSSQLRIYQTGIDQALKSQESAVVLSYARASDFAVTKISTIFLGFVLAFLGALYVLRATQVPFLLKATGTNKANVSLQTSSPGLVMIALGVLTINLALFSKSYVGVDVQSLGQIRGINIKPGENSPVSFRLPPFAVGSAELNRTQLSALSKLVDDMSANPNMQVTIDGETDPNESTEYSLALSDRRASAVKQFLVGRGVGAARVTTVSYGKEKRFDSLGKGSGATITRTDQPKDQK